MAPEIPASSPVPEEDSPATSTPNAPDVPATAEAPHAPTDAHPRGKKKRKRVSYELLSCAFGGHMLVGTDATRVRGQDSVFVLQEHDFRWHRCLRCDSWVALPNPQEPTRPHPPDREDIELPLRGKALRDKYVLRLIAIDRAFHFLVLGILSIAIFAFLSHRAQLRGEFYRVVTAIQGSVGGPTSNSHSTIIDDLRKLFSLKQSTLFALGLVAAAYAALEGVEAVGLWRRRRWAEYLTFIATTILLVPEIYELTGRTTVFKILALIINLAVVAYLLYAKRLFGLRGGGRADRAEIERDASWDALEREFPLPQPQKIKAPPSQAGP